MSGKPHILREVANGLIDEQNRYYPYMSATLSSSGTTSLVSKQGCRYFLRDCQLTVFVEGIKATSTAYIDGVIRGATKTYIQIGMPAQTLATDFFAVANYVWRPLLYDINSAITLTNTTTTARGNLTYAEVFENPGEYSQ